MATRRATTRQRGIALLIVLVLLVAGALAYVVGSLSPRLLEAYRTQKTAEALALAREAVIGYALKHRDEEGGAVMYGHLPLPDLGSSRNNNISCSGEGCDAGNFTGNGLNVTVIGRLPWRTLGTGPLRDGHGECLWYAVSGSHQRVHQATPMNWDTLGQLDIRVANGTGALASLVTMPHERPVAVIFSPGAALGDQYRGRDPLSTDEVDICGGNYNPANYLDPEPRPDPATAAGLAGVRNYFPTPSSPPPPPIYAFGNTGSGNDKPLATGGAIQKRASDDTLWPFSCPAGDACALVANDQGLALTSEILFGELRKSGGFRTNINSMLDRIVSCMRDRGITVNTAGFAQPENKTVGRVASDSCYDDTQHPLGYFSNYADHLFVAKRTTANFAIATGANCATPLADCPADSSVLIFGSQRSGSQSRSTAPQKALASNYLEGTNLTGFTGTGLAFCGPTVFGRVLLPDQSAFQDIIRCIPSTPSFSLVESPDLAIHGFGQLVSYNRDTRTLTLGHENVVTSGPYYAPGNALFGCAWQPEASPLGNGLRAYFQFRFRRPTDSPFDNVGNNGFVFAIADGISNGSNVCGAAASHLAYSGDNGVTPPLTFPKLGIEFDQGRNSGFSDTSSNPGRRDPCGTSACGGSAGYNSHAAIVYWGHEVANATDGVAHPESDDNVHGFPSVASQASATRPAPRNPDASPGIEFVNLRDQDSEGGDSYLYHVRVELTPTSRNRSGTAESHHTTYATEVWIERDSGTTAQLLGAMQNTTRPMAQLYPGYAAKLRDSAVMYDVAVAGSSCLTDSDCLTGQACGSDNVCYRQALGTVRLGFTGSQRTQDQQVDISNFFVSWPQ